MNQIGNNYGRNKTIYGLQEAFIAITPYFIISSIISLIIQGINVFVPISHSVVVTSASSSIQFFYPMILMISIAFHLARSYEIETHLAYLSSFLLYITALSTFKQHDSLVSSENAYLFNLLSFIVPIVTTYIIIKINKFIKENSLDKNSYQDYLKNYIMLFVITYLIGFLVILLVDIIFYERLATDFSNIYTLMNEIDIFYAMKIRSMISHLLFFLGMHGTNIYDAVFDTAYLSKEIYPFLTCKQYIDLFEPNTPQLAITLCIFYERKDQHAQAIAKLSAPFIVFNIGEILLYRLPIIFNRFLMVPFILVPVLNLWLANALIRFFKVAFQAGELPWTTPMIINVIVKCDNGSVLNGVCIQMVVIFIDCLIFYPFVKHFLATQSTTDQINLLTEKLNLHSDINYRKKIGFHENKIQAITAINNISRAIDLFSEQDLVIRYEPKINSTNSYCTSFEAVTVLDNDDDNGTITQWHLEKLAKANLSPVIDIWASELVAKDILQWQKVGFHPHISLGLHANTIEDKATLITILNNLRSFNVEFELCEQALLNENVTSIRENGFRIVTKNFGGGMTNFASLIDKNTDIIKINKTTFHDIQTVKNVDIYTSTIEMCKDLGYQVIVTGIKTEREFQISVTAGADLIQGSFVAERLKFNQVIPYTISINGSSSFFVKMQHY